MDEKLKLISPEEFDNSLKIREGEIIEGLKEDIIDLCNRILMRHTLDGEFDISLPDSGVFERGDQDEIIEQAFTLVYNEAIKTGWGRVSFTPRNKNENNWIVAVRFAKE